MAEGKEQRSPLQEALHTDQGDKWEDAEAYHRAWEHDHWDAREALVPWRRKAGSDYQINKAELLAELKPVNSPDKFRWS